MEENDKVSTPSPHVFFQKKYPVSWQISRKKQKTEKDQLNNLIDTTKELAKELKTINHDCKELTNGAQEICVSFVPFIPSLPINYLIKFARSATRIHNSACERYRTDIQIINNNLPQNYKLDQEQMKKKNAAYAERLRQKMLDPYIAELMKRGVSIDDDSTN